MPRVKLSNLPVDQLHAEIQRRLRDLPKLTRQRDELTRQIEELEGLGLAKPAAEEKAPAKRRGRKPGPAKGAKGGRRRKARNAISLSDALTGAMKAKGPLSVGDAMQAVQEAGYKSNSKIFRTIVNQTLAKEKRFKKVGRGTYALAE